jgi:hypothetical protein
MQESKGKKFYGKYRGTVVTNVDPLQKGRIITQVPAVSGLLPLTWATPCVPVGGLQYGFFAVPLVGAGVWVEFEGGDTDHPIWSGVYWGSAAEVPAIAQVVTPPVPAIALQTPLQNAVVVSDLPPSPATGGVMLKSASGAAVVVNDSGIYISNGKGATITLIGNVVSINGTALVVLGQ